MLGTQRLGMSDAEWRALSPRLLLARLKEYRDAEYRKNLRAGLIAAELRNSQRAKENDRIWVATDFFPDPNGKPEADWEFDDDDECDVQGIKRMFRGLRPGLN